MGTHPIFESDFDCLTEMEEVEFIRKCSKPHSSEVTTVQAQPNAAFFRFSAELQLSDIVAASFDEQIDIFAEMAVVGELKVSVQVINEVLNFDNRRLRRHVQVKAETMKKSDALEMTQSVVSKLTTDLQLISETKTITAKDVEKSTQLEFVTDLGYKMTRTTNHATNGQTTNELLFKSKTPRVIMGDGAVFLLQRLMPKIGVYEIELPFCDIDSKLVSISSLSSIGHKTMEFGSTSADVVGIKRVHNSIRGPDVYNIWMFEDGHIAQRETELGKVQLKVAQMPELATDKEDELPKIELKPLNWRDDIQLKSIYRQKATDFSQSNSQYLEENPQILQSVRDFYNAVLAEKPEDIFDYSKQFFTAYGTR